MRSALSYAVLGLILVSALTLYPVGVYAQSTAGDFVKYSFSHSGERSGSGSLGLKVVEDFGNGTLRAEMSGSHNNADFLFRSNVPEAKFHFPYLPEIPEISHTVTRENGSITINIQKLADDEVSLQGTDWVLGVYRVTVAAEGVRNGSDMAVSLDGDLKVLAESGLFYGFSGIVKSVDREKQLSISLIDTNLDLSVKPISNLSLVSHVDALASLGLGQASLGGQTPAASASMIGFGEAMLGSSESINPASPGSGTASTSTYLLVVAVIGVVAVVSFFSVRSFRRGRRVDSSGEKPLHWVN